MPISNILQNYKILHLFRFLTLRHGAEVQQILEPPKADAESCATAQQFYVVVSLKQSLKALFCVTKITLVSQNAPS